MTTKVRKKVLYLLVFAFIFAPFFNISTPKSISYATTPQAACVLENSMQRPVSTVQINQLYLYGESYYNSETGKTSRHEGVDFSVSGANVYAAYAGTVAFVRSKHYSEVTDSYGNCIVLEHQVNGKYIYTIYAHMTNSITLTTGTQVAKGAYLGISGNTGNSTGAHLHFSVAESSTRKTFSGIGDVNSFFSSLTTFNTRNPERYFAYSSGSGKVMGISYNNGGTYPTASGQAVTLHGLQKTFSSGYTYSQNYDYSRTGGPEKWLAGDVAPGMYSVSLKVNGTVKKTLYIQVVAGQTTYVDFDIGTTTSDSYEFNNTIATAANKAAITANAVRTTYISNSKDVDFYKITTTTAQTLTATLSQLPADYNLMLCTPEGSVIALSVNSSTSSEQLTYSLSPNTVYYLKVYGSNSSYDIDSPYRLQLTLS